MFNMAGLHIRYNQQNCSAQTCAHPHRNLLAQDSLEAQATALWALVIFVLLPFCLRRGLPASAACLTRVPLNGADVAHLHDLLHEVVRWWQVVALQAQQEVNMRRPKQ
jgi:hypothetical protein